MHALLSPSITPLLPVIHALPDAAGLVDAHGRLRAANGALVQLLGLSSCGRTLLELTGSEPLFAAAARALGGAGAILDLDLPLLDRRAQVRLAPLRPGRPGSSKHDAIVRSARGGCRLKYAAQ